MPGDTEVVRLTLPAISDYVRIARLASSGVAERMGFDFEEVDELRIAVDELCHAAIETLDGGTLDVLFELDGDRVSIEVRSENAESVAAFGLSPLSEQILAAIVDEWAVGSDGGFVWCRFSKQRRGDG